MPPPSGRLGALALSLVLTGACSGDPDRDAAPSTPPTPTTVATDPTPPPSSDPDVPHRLEAAVSTPESDSVYPALGDPRLDSLHYDLDLTWAPETRTLTGNETLELRVTTDSPHIQLDLSDALVVSSVRVDGRRAHHSQADGLLTVTGPWRRDGVYTLVVRYAGTPEPAPAPSERGDLGSIGLNTTPDDELWTLQEPYGAFTWYAVSDQPSDKAFYDFTLRVPSPWVGVANGRLESRSRTGAHTVTRWHLDQPASSYLTTVAFGVLTMTDAGSVNGTAVTYWTPTGDARTLRRVRRTAQALTWVEGRLGPYPFATLGVLVPRSFPSGMETQAMITLGSHGYATSPAVLVHELVHQWYGDLVTPADWRDMWMNEGMAMYLQKVWEAEHSDRPLDRLMAEMVPLEAESRREYGPPGAYDRDQFAQGNVYYGPALMWHELRRKVGDDTFWKLVRGWPSVHAYGNAGREQLVYWVDRQTGRRLGSFFDAWLMAENTPPRG